MPVAIGEDMRGRVIPWATKNGADRYRGAWTTRERRMNHKQHWIQAQRAIGRPIIDLGQDPGRLNYPNPTSRYYGLEVQEAQGYPNYAKQSLPEPERLQLTGGNYH